MTNAQARKMRLRNKRIAEAAQASREAAKPAPYRTTADGATSHAKWRADHAGRACVTAPEGRWFGDRRAYQSLIREVNVAPVQAWLDERAKRTAPVRMEDL